jgi:Ca-activated chloride channel homolog
VISDPRVLLLLLLVLPLAWISYRRYRRAAPGVVAMAGGEAQRTANVFLIRWFFSSFFYLLALVLVVISMAGVRWGRPTPSERPAEVEVVFVFDVSKSMLAADITPSRLARSVAIARNVVAGNPGGSFGIVIFKGTGQIFLPVTSDVTSITTYLDSIGEYLMTAPGTNIEAGLETAMSAFPGVRDTRRCIVAFTDGGFFEGDPVAAGYELAAAGIELVLIAAGRDTPVTIPTEAGVLLDERGIPVRTAVRLDVTEAIAAAAAGAVYRLDDGDLVERIGSFISGAGAPVYGPLRERYRTLLAAGLVCLAIWVVIRTVRWGGVF